MLFKEETNFMNDKARQVLTKREIRIEIKMERDRSYEAYQLSFAVIFDYYRRKNYRTAIDYKIIKEQEWQKIKPA